MVVGLSGLVEKALEVVVSLDNRTDELAEQAQHFVDAGYSAVSLALGQVEAVLSNLRDDIEVKEEAASPYDSARPKLALTRNEKIAAIKKHLEGKGGVWSDNAHISGMSDQTVGWAYDALMGVRRGK